MGSVARCLLHALAELELMLLLQHLLVAFALLLLRGDLTSDQGSWTPVVSPTAALGS